MKTIEEREQNLFNATETMTQFYDEIESLLSILFTEMERAGFSGKTERLRSGTATTKNLTRRLLATATTMYIKDSSGLEQGDDEQELEDEEDNDEGKKVNDTDVNITKETKIPLITLHLFEPRIIPTAHTLSSPELLIGCISNFEFVDRKTEEPSKANSNTIGLSNLGQIHLKPKSRVGNMLKVHCWKPKTMRAYRIQCKVTGFESINLLEIDSQDKIKAIAKKLIGYCE